MVLIFDMFLDVGSGGGNGRKAMAMLPQLERPKHLCICKSIFGYLTVYHVPTQGNGAKPQRKFTSGAFG